jgi:hypothetical protein
MKLSVEPGVNDSIKLMASVTLKNFVKAEWNPVAKQSILNKSDKDQIKQNMVSLMLNCSGNVRKQLSEVINTISIHDFYKEWPSLLEVIQKNTKPLGISFQASNFRFEHHSRSTLRCSLYFQKIQRQS